MRLATALALILAAAPAAADPVVVELFTSQGCSSCPPADAMLGELAARDDVIALALHVDYWDWIGWADTFGDPAHADRQRAYAKEAGSSVVYTPQFVVDGQIAIEGAKGMALADAIQARAAQAREVLSVEGGSLTMAPIGRPAQIVLVELIPAAEVAILRGENAGRAMAYHHIVTGWTVLAEWDGAAGTLALPTPDDDGRARVVLAQEVLGSGRPGPILGAARAP